VSDVREHQIKKHVRLRSISGIHRGERREQQGGKEDLGKRRGEKKGFGASYFICDLPVVESDDVVMVIFTSYYFARSSFSFAAKRLPISFCAGVSK
jgi:hypothetical protein